MERFHLERYFAGREFDLPLSLSSSDCEPLTRKMLLSYADRESKQLWDELSLGYTESQGHPLLRTEISMLYREITSEQILEIIPEEGIYIAMRSLLRSGDAKILAPPATDSKSAFFIFCAFKNFSNTSRNRSSKQRTINA